MKKLLNIGVVFLTIFVLFTVAAWLSSLVGLAIADKESTPYLPLLILAVSFISALGCTFWIWNDANHIVDLTVNKFKRYFSNTKPTVLDDYEIQHTPKNPYNEYTNKLCFSHIDWRIYCEWWWDEGPLFSFNVLRKKHYPEALFKHFVLEKCYKAIPNPDEPLDKNHWVTVPLLQRYKQNLVYFARFHRHHKPDKTFTTIFVELDKENRGQKCDIYIEYDDEHSTFRNINPCVNKDYQGFITAILRGDDT